MTTLQIHSNNFILRNVLINKILRKFLHYKESKTNWSNGVFEDSSMQNEIKEIKRKYESTKIVEKSMSL
jgi:hypothetical protein